MSCACKETPVVLEQGRLQMLVRVGHVLARLDAALQTFGLPYSTEGGIVSVDIRTAQERERLCDGLLKALTPVERETIRAVYLTSDAPPTNEDYFDSDTLDHQLAMLKAGWLRQVLRDGALTSVLQPIVHATQPAKVFAYEALLRFSVDGELRSAGNVFDVARRAGLVPVLDRVARESAIAVGAKYFGDAKLFVNFTPSSIYDPVSCLKSTTALLDRLGVAHERIVFEVIESERISDVAYLRKILEYYRERGFGIALDDLGSGYASLNLLNELRPDFAKMDMELIRGIDGDPYKAALVSKLIEAAQNIGLQVVAEGIETAEELAWVVERGVPLVQGYYIALPNAPPTFEGAYSTR